MSPPEESRQDRFPTKSISRSAILKTFMRVHARWDACLRMTFTGRAPARSSCDRGANARSMFMTSGAMDFASWMRRLCSLDADYWFTECFWIESNETRRAGLLENSALLILREGNQRMTMKSVRSLTIRSVFSSTLFVSLFLLVLITQWFIATAVAQDLP